MKKDIANKWIEALLSGKYKQGKGLLKNNRNEYCCLGVLCEISGISQFEEIYDRFHNGISNYYLGIEATLPVKVREYSGVDNEMASFIDKNGDYYSLAKLNDNGETFKTISKIIKSNYKYL